MGWAFKDEATILAVDLEVNSIQPSVKRRAAGREGGRSSEGRQRLVSHLYAVDGLLYSLFFLLPPIPTPVDPCSLSLSFLLPSCK